MKRTLAALVAIASALLAAAWLSGCAAGAIAAAAMQAVPATLGVASYVGAKSGEAMSADDAFGDDQEDERCEQLVNSPPGVVEVQVGAAPHFRPMGLARVDGRMTWVVARDSADGAGPSAAEMAQVEFAPPLRSAIAGQTAYLAYAPAQPVSAADSDRMVALAAVFDGQAGTFRWRSQVLNYVVVKTLPCFRTAS